MALEAKHRAALLGETAISMAIFGFGPATVLWLAGALPPLTLLGQRPIVAPLLMGAGVGTFMMTVCLTLAVRARVARQLLPALAWSVAERGPIRYLPGALLIRASVLAIAAIVVFVPLGLAVAAVLRILPLSVGGFFLANLFYGAAIGAVMTRFVVFPALAD